MERKRNLFNASSISIIALVLIFMGATYAYLIKYWRDDDVNVPLQVTTNTTDSLALSVDADVAILATPDNYDIGMKSETSTSKAMALLQANNKTNKVVDHYYIYLDIIENEFIYTSEEKNPELLLHIVDPNGNIITDINGLEYKSVVDSKGDTLSGFDITTWKNIITIASFYEIATDTKVSQEWEIGVSFVNLATPQKDNTGKGLRAKILMQKASLPLSDLCTNISFGRCLSENYAADSNLYLHNSSLENGAGDGSYRYSGSYENVENYVCFGYDGEDECPHDNLYRIIGVFDNKVKLIKADYAKVSELGNNSAYASSYTNSGTSKGTNLKTDIGSYYWSYNRGSTNSWSSSYLNAYNLNGTFLNTFSNEWKEKIAVTNWMVGGTSWANISNNNASQIYQNEIVNMTTGQPAVNNKIGLMYASDYMYGANPKYWNYLGCCNASSDYRVAKDDNWLYMGLHEWILSRSSNTTDNTVYIDYSGYLYPTYSYGAFAVRPVFYLNENVIKTTGSGSSSDPYRLLNVIESA